MMVKLRHLNSVGDIKCIGEAALVLEMQFWDFFFCIPFLFQQQCLLQSYHCIAIIAMKQIILFTKSICRYITNSFMQINCNDGDMNKDTVKETRIGGQFLPV